MAAVQLADIYNPVTFARRAQEAQTDLNRFIQSGVAYNDGTLQGMLNTGGNTGELPHFNALTLDEPNYSSDNPASASTPAKISGVFERFRSAARNKSWSTMDLSRELALQDPVGAITGRIANYWRQDDEQRVLSSLVGIQADNAANDSGDMIIDVATDDVAAVADAERIGGQRVIDTLQTMGDHKNMLNTLALHSQIHARLQLQDLIVYERAAGSDIMFETYLGKRLIVDDNLPTVSGTNRITYTCVMFGPQVIATGNGRVNVPSETERVASQGDGGGQDILHSRVNNVWHVNGFDFLSATLTGQASLTANYADLKLAANWNRLVARKNVPIAFIDVND